MDSPLKYDEALKKEFKIGEEAEQDVAAKIGYVRTQIDQMVQSLWRIRTDAIIAQYQVDTATDENVRAKHQSQLAEHRLIIGQFVNSIKVLNKLLDEFKPTQEG